MSPRDAPRSMNEYSTRFVQHTKTMQYEGDEDVDAMFFQLRLAPTTASTSSWRSVPDDTGMKFCFSCKFGNLDTSEYIIPVIDNITSSRTVVVVVVGVSWFVGV